MFGNGGSGEEVSIGGTTKLGRESRPYSEWLSKISLGALVLVGMGLVWQKVNARGNEWLGAGERARFLSKSDTEEEHRVQYRDWLRV